MSTRILSNRVEISLLQFYFILSRKLNFRLAEPTPMTVFWIIKIVGASYFFMQSYLVRRKWFSSKLRSYKMYLFFIYNIPYINLLPICIKLREKKLASFRYKSKQLLHNVYICYINSEWRLNIKLKSLQNNYKVNFCETDNRLT